MKKRLNEWLQPSLGIIIFENHINIFLRKDCSELFNIKFVGASI